MPQIRVICLGHTEELIGKYDTMPQLRDAVFQTFSQYLVKKNGKEKLINFKLTYMEKFGTNSNEFTEKLLEDISVITEHNGERFDLFVKRIWDECCACVRPFGITPDQIPCECQNLYCGYQYCNDCVQKMRKFKHESRKIFCMYCMKSSSDGPTQNKFLLDLLWEQYMAQYGVKLLPKTGTLPKILINDIECRVIHLRSLIQTVKGKTNQNTHIPESIDSEIERANMLIIQIENIKKKTIELVSANINDETINDYLNEYIKWLTGNGDNNRKCEHFISICEQLLYYNRKLEFEKHFPTLNKKMNDWEDLLYTNEEFQPKIKEVFQAVETDLGHHIIPSIPCRVGFIGITSVGKSSLMNWLRGIRTKAKWDKNLQEKKVTDDENPQNKISTDDKNLQKKTTVDEENPQNVTAMNNILVSPVRVSKSTYCRLEFEYEYAKDKKVIFVDIEGSNDSDLNLKSANYYEEILKADCDLYLIIFENQFTDVQHAWYEYITKKLVRQCWLVRSKVDQFFHAKFDELVDLNFDSMTDADKDRFRKKIVDQIKDEVSLNDHAKELPDVYLTTTSGDTDVSELFNSHVKFNIEKLVNDIKELPIRLHGHRLQKMAMHAMASVINNCFRRGYVVNIMKYKIAAGVAAAIPLGDLIPRYLGREEIRQAFGVNTNSYLMNWIRRTKNEFNEYLKKFGIEIDRSSFETSAFKNTFKISGAHAKGVAKNVTLSVSKGVAAFGIAGISVSDDFMRVIGIGAISSVRGVSASLTAFGVVLTACLCAWAAVSNGKQMCDYLNRLCDDLITVSDHVTVKMIEKNDTIRDASSETK